MGQPPLWTLKYFSKGDEKDGCDDDVGEDSVLEVMVMMMIDYHANDNDKDKDRDVAAADDHDHIDFEEVRVWGGYWW